GGPVTATAKPLRHVPTTNPCDTCHNTSLWINVRFNHADVTGTCFSCHNNLTVSGKPGNHLPTANTCDMCHVTIAWRSTHFNHSGAVGTCASCHNNASARGKPANHLPTNNVCELCHTTTAWRPARFNHTGTRAVCRDSRRLSVPGDVPEALPSDLRQGGADPVRGLPRHPGGSRGPVHAPIVHATAKRPRFACGVVLRGECARAAVPHAVFHAPEDVPGGARKGFPQPRHRRARRPGDRGMSAGRAHSGRGAGAGAFAAADRGASHPAADTGASRPAADRRAPWEARSAPDIAGTSGPVDGRGGQGHDPAGLSARGGAVHQGPRVPAPRVHAGSPRAPGAGPRAQRTARRSPDRIRDVSETLSSRRRGRSSAAASRRPAHCPGDAIGTAARGQGLTAAY